MPGFDPRFAGLRNVTDSGGTVTVWLTGTGRGMPVTRTTSLRHCPWPGATAASEWGRRGPQQQPHHSWASAVARVRWLVVRSSCLVLLLPLGRRRRAKVSDDSDGKRSQRSPPALVTGQ